ncbi:syntaxin-binding protein 4 isoform X1 [Gadus morhua]|uniref:syntaxin-binding protein 4 isoform X1 n=2 Tax=Gadus morhua TaxID=8049 RepID=UPI0011B7CEDC|nr:syntaxin-binding protein 4 isoform X1 [Gadus morhua]
MRAAERFDGLSLLYWTIMGPHGINRAVQRLEFCDCKKGLGVKITGGYREITGEDFGVYIKRVVAGGLADQDGRLRSGDLILDVNNNSLIGVTNERAVEILRTAAYSNHMSLLVARDNESRREFAEFMEKYGSSTVSRHSGRISPTQLSTVKLTDTASSSSSSRSESPLLLSPKEGVGTTSASTHGPPYTPLPAYHSSPYSVQTPLPQVFSDSLIRLICVSKGTGLGLVIKGGTNSPEGPMVFIQEMVPGGDCQKDGRLQVGDQLVSINKESLIGASNEEAQSILASTKLRPDPTVEIAFIRRRSSSGSSSETQSPTISLQGPVGGTVSQASAPGLGPLHSQAGLLTKLPPVAVRPPPPSIALPTPPVLNVSQVHVAPVRTEPKCVSTDSAIDTWPDPPPSGHTADVPAPPWKSSLGPQHRLKLERLEQALDVLGLKPTDLQRQALRSRLRADTAGTVAYAEFESLSKELFKPQLQDGVPVSQVGSKFSSDDLSSLLESPTNPLPSLSDSDDLEEMERLRKDHIEALREIQKLQVQLAESQRLHLVTEEELNKVKQEVQSGAVESRALRCRVQLAEVAQKQARGMEMDYEEVIHLLETEIAELKTQRAGQPFNPKEEAEELKKRVAVLECQLRKSEGAKKSFELSTGKLLNFVETVQDFLQDTQGTSKSNSSGEAKVGPVALAPAPRHKKGSWTVATLSQEAKDLTRTVRAILEVDCLPYGWDEAYTAEGVKYFINHVTQTTSWSPPVTPVSPKSPPAPERVTEGGRGEEEGEEEEKEEEEEKGKTNTSV